MLEVIHVFFLLFHIALISFNCFGWYWVCTRRLHLITVTLTWASWMILGLRYGFGYCPITDWHWQVLQHLGKTDLPASYLKYLIDTLTGLDVNAGLVDALAVIGLFTATIIALYLQFLTRKRE